MKFRPCIDIHNGKVKQIVGSSLKDEQNMAKENYVSDRNADYYAKLYKENHLFGGHIILLNAKDSIYYEETKKQALLALYTYPNGLQVGGGITDENAKEFIDAGASHVIVTSYVFQDGILNRNHLEKIASIVGKEKLVLDLSCRKKDNRYYIVTDRWQKFTNQIVDTNLLRELSAYCDEFLIHAVDVEGKNSGIEIELIKCLSNNNNFKITYAGGISNESDIKKLEKYSDGKIDFTIGSALDIFGGNLSFDKIVQQYSK